MAEALGLGKDEDLEWINLPHLLHSKIHGITQGRPRESAQILRTGPWSCSEGDQEFPSWKMEALVQKVAHQGRSLYPTLWSLKHQKIQFPWPGENFTWKNCHLTISSPTLGIRPPLWISMNILLVQRSETEKSRSEILLSLGHPS